MTQAGGRRRWGDTQKRAQTLLSWQLASLIRSKTLNAKKLSKIVCNHFTFLYHMYSVQCHEKHMSALYQIQSAFTLSEAFGWPIYVVQIDLLLASVLSILSISQRWSDLNGNHKVMYGKNRDILYINRNPYNFRNK